MPGKLFHSHMCWRSGVAEHLLAGCFPGPFGLEPVPIAPQILQALVWEAGHFQGCSSTDRRPQRVPSPKCSTSCHAAACALALVIFQCRSGSELPARQPECDTSLDCWATENQNHVLSVPSWQPLRLASTSIIAAQTTWRLSQAPDLKH